MGAGLADIAVSRRAFALTHFAKHRVFEPQLNFACGTIHHVLRPRRAFRAALGAGHMLV